MSTTCQTKVLLGLGWIGASHVPVPTIDPMFLPVTSGYIKSIRWNSSYNSIILTKVLYSSILHRVQVFDTRLSIHNSSIVETHPNSRYHKSTS